MLTGEDANSVGPFGTAAAASEGLRATGRSLNGMDQSVGRSVTAIRPENLVIRLLTRAVLAGCQFQFRKGNKTIPDIRQFQADVPVGFCPLP